MGKVAADAFARDEAGRGIGRGIAGTRTVREILADPVADGGNSRATFGTGEFGCNEALILISAAVAGIEQVFDRLSRQTMRREGAKVFEPMKRPSYLHLCFILDLDPTACMDPRPGSNAIVRADAVAVSGGSDARV